MSISHGVKWDLSGEPPIKLTKLNKLKMWTSGTANASK